VCERERERTRREGGRKGRGKTERKEVIPLRPLHAFWHGMARPDTAWDSVSQVIPASPSLAGI
jgi:hypothetical protein